MTTPIHRFAWLPVPVLLVAMLTFWLTNPPWMYSSPALLLALNLVFAMPAALLIAGLLARTFYRRGTAGLLWIGSAVLLWALTGLFACHATGRDANLAVTLGNTANALSGFCHLVGVVLATRGMIAGPGRRMAWIAGAYGLAVAVVALVVLVAGAGRLPVFFVQGQGGTPVRQVVLLIAFVCFSSAALLLQTEPRSRGSALARWYGGALWLTAGSFIAISLQPAVGSALFWTGRAFEFLGGGFLLVAAFAARERQGWEISLAGALRESERRLAAFAVATFEGIVESEDGRILDCNEQFARLAGCSVAELKGQPIPELIAPEDRQRVCANLAANRETVLEHTMVRADGSRLLVEVHGRPSGQRRFTAVRDITARKAAEAAVRAQAEQLDRSRQAALNLARDATAAKAAAERTAEELDLALAGSGGAQWSIPVSADSGELVPDSMEVSPRLKAMIGFSDDELASTVSAWQARIHPADLPRVQASAQAHIAGRAPAHCVEYRIRHKDGTWRWIASTGRLFRNAAGQPVRWAGVDYDITTRKQAETALQQHAKELTEANQDLARFNDAMVGRELRMIELKREINALCRQVGQAERYEVDGKELGK